MLNYNFYHIIRFSNILKIWSLKKQEHKQYLTNRKKIYKNWFSYKNLFCNTLLNTLQRIIVINYERYNYNLILYMCKLKSDVKISILDFCVTVGLFIPHYCYHPDLSIAGNCRMCLIQLDGSVKPIVACAIILTRI